MYKSTFKIEKMDCPSEEQLIRMKLEGDANIQSLEFDIANRSLGVIHKLKDDNIFENLKSLKLDSKIISIQELEDYHELNENSSQKKMLWQVLAINLFFFIIEMVTGLIGNSMGLVADSLDMFADSIVYGLSLIAVGGAIILKKRIARVSGYFQLILALIGLFEVLRRVVKLEMIVDFKMMMVISFLALIGNVICLKILQKNNSQEAHMKASMIFTSNDVVVNIGVMLAGLLVFLTSSRIPDLVIGLIVFIIVGRGAIRILQLSK